MAAHDFISVAKEKLLLWWLVGVWFILFSGSALCTAIVAALYGMRWNAVERQDKFVICLLVFINWSTVMMAFFSKAVARVQQGELPIIEGDTRIISQKTTVAATTTTAVEKPLP